MITGDHGTNTAFGTSHTAGGRSDEMIAERMSVFSAYRLPGCEHTVYPDVSQVNGARLVVNCAVGANLPLLPDAQYWAPTNFKGDTVDVGPRLNG